MTAGFKTPLGDENINARINVQIIVFATLTIAIMVLTIYCIKVYAEKKQKVIEDMVSETATLERILYNDLNYSKYFVNLLANQVLEDYRNKEYIQKVLKKYVTSSNFNTLFGWKKYTWLNAKGEEQVSSLLEKATKENEFYFIKELLKENNGKDKTFFHSTKTHDNQPSLMLVKNLSNLENGAYIGSIILTYDIQVMIKRLNIRRKNEHTNFLLLDQNLKVVASSKQIIENIIDQNENLSPFLKKNLEKNDFFRTFSKEISYLDMVSGVNYYIKKIDGLPFIIIVNLETTEVQHDIIEGAIKKLTEVAIISLIFIFIIRAIYKRETTLRAKAEEAMLTANIATKAKSDFLVFTAHEIRSPLGFISTGSEMMIKELFGKLPEEYKKYVEGIHQSSRLILDFITDILDENQILEGKFKIVNSIHDIDKIIEEAIITNRLRFNERKIEIFSDLPEDLPKLICDKRRILQVISNLISNAFKYSRDDTKIRINARVVNDQLEVEVIDQGYGMSEEEIRIALSTHGVVRKNNQTFIDSYGLGLPIVKMLVDAHEATLTITSEPNVGTCVKITFPKYKLLYKVQKET